MLWSELGVQSELSDQGPYLGQIVWQKDLLGKILIRDVFRSTPEIARTEEALATAFQQSVILRSPQSRPRRSLKQSISELVLSQ
jgi:hypothetical protein